MKTRPEVLRYFLLSAFGAALATLLGAWLLFNTSLGYGMPSGVKIGGPILCFGFAILHFVSNIKRRFPRAR